MTAAFWSPAEVQVEGSGKGPCPRRGIQGIAVTLAPKAARASW